MSNYIGSTVPVNMPRENAHLVDEATAFEAFTQYTEISAEEEFTRISAACVAYLEDDRKFSFEAFVPDCHLYDQYPCIARRPDRGDIYAPNYEWPGTDRAAGIL
ncbi:hypothetical protein J4E89_009286 [Alternaria sp. Ai002NY15]|nr:hypothetical protein J4E89_009286 [Alternaria sp. Ai002NY15]